MRIPGDGPLPEAPCGGHQTAGIDCFAWAYVGKAGRTSRVAVKGHTKWWGIAGMRGSATPKRSGLLPAAGRLPAFWTKTFGVRFAAFPIIAHGLVAEAPAPCGPCVPELLRRAARQRLHQCQHGEREPTHVRDLPLGPIDIHGSHRD